MRKWKKGCAGLLTAAMAIGMVAPGAVKTVDAANTVVDELIPKWQYDFEGNLEETDSEIEATAKQDHLSSDYTGEIQYVTGRDGAGQAVYLDGSYGLDLNLPSEGRTADYTISFWANPQADMGWADSLINWGVRATGNNDNWISLAGNGIWSAINNQNNNMVGYTRVNNEWQQYIISVQGNTASIYRNGMLDCTQTVSETAFTNLDSTMCLGINAWDTNANCQFDEVKIYDVAVDATQAELLYKGGSAITTETQYIRIGKTIELDTVNVAALSDCTVNWVSDNSDIATVEDGIVTGKSKGTATITANWIREGRVVASDSIAVNVLQEKGQLIADFTFDDADEGLKGAGAVATPVGDVAFADENGGTVLDMRSGNVYLDVKKEDGSSLLTGCEELTVSYDRNNVTDGHNWVLYATSEGTTSYVGIKDFINGWIDTFRGPNVASNAYGGTGWHHVDVVFAEDGIRIYADSVLVNEYPNKTESLTGILKEDSKLWIGRSDWDDGEYFKGYLDNFKIYNYALTAEEVADEFAGKEEADKTALQAAVDSAIADTDADKYTEASWAVYTAALADAKAILADADATQENVDAAVAALGQATEALVTKEAELESIKAAAIEELNSYANADDYREDEKATLQVAIAGGTKAIQAATTAEEVTKALTDAKEVIDGIPTDAALAEKEFNEAMENAYTVLESYKADVIYLTEQQQEYDAIISDAYEAIEGMSSAEEINQYIASVKAQIDALPTAEELTVTKVTINEGSEMALEEGADAVLTAVVEAGEKADKTVNWSSSDDSIVSVAQDGKITANSVGEAVITASVKENADSDNNITAKITITVEAKKYTVSINNAGTIEEIGRYEALDLVKVTAPEAPEGQKFVYWKTDKDKIVCYAANYSFYVMEDVTLIPVYAEAETEVEEQVTLLCTSTYNKNTNKMSFTAKRSLPAGYKVVSHGVIITDSKGWSAFESNEKELFVIGASRTMKATAKTTGLQGTYVASRTCTATDTWYGKAFLIYLDKNGEEHTVYSDVTSCQAIVK